MTCRNASALQGGPHRAFTRSTMRNSDQSGARISRLARALPYILDREYDFDACTRKLSGKKRTIFAA